ncbi:hypothetical protein ACTHAM_001294 [Cellulomonas soli]|uniref:hypothetical protein n=1 Tax=Cellulomonas soli TaxID=931535 RepID=UPI003F85B029
MDARRRWVLVGGVVLVAIAAVVLWLTRASFLLGDDSAQEVTVLDQYTGLPPGVEEGAADRGAVVSVDPAQILVYTSGSSTCPLVPQTYEVNGVDVVITVATGLPEDTPCTADLVPTTTVVQVPDGLDAADIGKVTLVDG